MPIKILQRKSVMMAVAYLALMSVTQALAAPRHIEDYCFSQAAQIWFNGRGDREHFIANCIADNTPEPPAKRSPYKKPRS